MWFIYGCSYWNSTVEDTQLAFGVVYARDFGDACDKLCADYSEIENIKLEKFFPEGDGATLEDFEITDMKNQVQKMKDKGI